MTTAEGNDIMKADSLTDHLSEAGLLKVCVHSRFCSFHLCRQSLVDNRHGLNGDSFSLP